MTTTSGDGKPRGRRPGTESSRPAIVAAARTEFARLGYDGATMRSIAARADVDPATIYRFFGGKRDLLAAAVEFPVSPDVVEAVLAQADGPDAMLRALLGLWRRPEIGERLIALLRVAASNPEAAAIVSDLVRESVLGPLADRIGGDDAELRAGLVATQIAGLALLRLVIPTAPISSASDDELVASIAPTLDRFFGDSSRRSDRG